MANRFLDPHYLLNGALLASYALLRLHFLQAAEEGRRLPGHFIANTRDLENWVRGRMGAGQQQRRVVTVAAVATTGT